jgi:ribonuclease D
MDTIYSRLKSWRRNLAISLNVPTFFILSNAHLAHIALDRPASLEELAACPGVGPKKLAQFGELLLGEIALCMAEGLEPGVAPPPAPQEAEPLSEADVAVILAGLRHQLASQLVRKLKGRYTTDQVETVLSRLSVTA